MEAFCCSGSSPSSRTLPQVSSSVFLIGASTRTGLVAVCACARARRWQRQTLDHQLISHAGRHQRGLELTLRVGGRSAPAISHLRPLQRRQTYTALIRIEMKRWSCATCRRRRGGGEIKLQKSRRRARRGSLFRWFGPAASR